MKNLSIFSQKQVSIFKTVATELKVPTKGKTTEKMLNELHEVLKNTDRKQLTKTQIAVLNTFNAAIYAEKRDLRIQGYTASKPGVCEFIKINAIKSTKENPVNVKKLAEMTAEKFNKDVKKMLVRVKSQLRTYLPKEHGILFEKIDVENYYCSNPDWANTRLK